jgi:hypothetical protein
MQKFLLLRIVIQTCGRIENETSPEFDTKKRLEKRVK